MRTHVLAPVSMLRRRADGADAIGAALLDRADGLGYRRVAARVGRPFSTVRGWLDRLSGNAERVRVVFTLLLHALDDDPPVLAPTGSALGDAVAAGHRPYSDGVTGWPGRVIVPDGQIHCITSTTRRPALTEGSCSAMRRASSTEPTR